MGFRSEGLYREKKMTYIGKFRAKWIWEPPSEPVMFVHVYKQSGDYLVYVPYINGFFELSSFAWYGDDK